MADDDLRLPLFFPRVPKQCKDAAAPFFDCFSRESDYDLGKVRRGVGWGEPATRVNTDGTTMARQQLCPSARPGSGTAATAPCLGWSGGTVCARSPRPRPHQARATVLTDAQRACCFPPCLNPQDPGMAREALRTCKDKLPAYVECAEKHMTAKQRELVLAPQVYRDQAAQGR